MVAPWENENGDTIYMNKNGFCMGNTGFFLATFTLRKDGVNYGSFANSSFTNCGGNNLLCVRWENWNEDFNVSLKKKNTTENMKVPGLILVLCTQRHLVGGYNIVYSMCSILIPADVPGTFRIALSLLKMKQLTVAMVPLEQYWWIIVVDHMNNLIIILCPNQHRTQQNYGNIL